MEILGWIGAVIILSSYALVSNKKLAPDGFRYQAMNISGSLLLGIYALWHSAVASVVVNLVWLCIGLIAVVKIFKRRSIPSADKL